MSSGQATEVRVLGPPDCPALFEFLEGRLETSLFLVANAEAAGLEDHGQPLQATYTARFDHGQLTAVAAHCWNGVVLVQGEIGLEEAVLEAVRRTGRPVHGLIGPLALVERARRALGMEATAAAKSEPEVLYALRVDRLRVPAVLGVPGLVCRPATPDEVAGVLVDWRVAFSVEALGASPTPALREKAARELTVSSHPGWVLLDGGRPVSYSTFNAQARHMVQVGGVFTPPDLRGRGYGRAVVAGSLLAARAAGATRSVLFTGRGNVAAQRAYVSLGYEEVGPFGLLLFR